MGEQLYLSLSSALRRSLSPATHNRRAMKHFHMKIDYGSSFPFVSFFFTLHFVLLMLFAIYFNASKRILGHTQRIPMQQPQPWHPCNGRAINKKGECRAVLGPDPVMPQSRESKANESLSPPLYPPSLDVANGFSKCNHY